MMKMVTPDDEEKSGVSMKLVMMVVLVATCFSHYLHARNSNIDFLTAAAQLEGGEGNGKDCCDNCIKLLIYPPKYVCADAGGPCSSSPCDECPPKCATVAPNEAIVSSTHTDPTA